MKMAVRLRGTSLIGRVEEASAWRTDRIVVDGFNEQVVVDAITKMHPRACVEFQRRRNS